MPLTSEAEQIAWGDRAMIKQTIGLASEKEIANHLLTCDFAFNPPLSSRVNIRSYAHKIFKNAQCFEAWDSGALVGLAAVYCNNRETDVAFVTSLSVIPNWHGTGVASGLVECCCRQLHAAGLRTLGLQVHESNSGALAFYEKQHFRTVSRHGGVVNMMLNLEGID